MVSHFISETCTDIHIQRTFFFKLPATAPRRVFTVNALLYYRSPAACRGLGQRLPFPLDKAHYSARRDRQQVLPGTQNYSSKNSTRITERSNTITLTS